MKICDVFQDLMELFLIISMVLKTLLPEKFDLLEMLLIGLLKIT